MIKEDYKYSDYTEKVIGALKVYQRMRNGFPEVISNGLSGVLKKMLCPFQVKSA